MESVDLDHDGIEETSDKQLFSPSSPDRTDIFGDPQVNTRVGDDYQAEIPSMMTEFKRLQLLMNPADSGVVVDVSQSFLMGLPIPITWVQEVDDIENETQGFRNNHDEAVNPNGPVELRNRAKLLIKLKRKGSAINLEPLAVGLDHEKESRTENVGNIVAGKTSLAGQHKSKRYCPVPGSKCDPWNDAEVKSFILGLYIFGKNFVSIKRFLENKELGEILSFYYGEFYRSDDYRRWSDSRKVRSRKCITGRKIFTGWRLQELISRLLPNVPEEFQITLLEGSKSFAEGRTSLEEYVSSLKSTVGILILVEAVGIGKGKDDLTGLAMEPGKMNQTFQVCPNLPTGKACSSLTPSEIIKFLTGGFRLSKARCNDIFWEAVWPRLLARGWHSEQPKNQGYVSSKHCLVFLMPGVKKFSRRKLVKGDHYFDSVRDVLSKVASEPKLLELEAEGATLQSCNENGWVPEVTSDPDDPSNHQRHCYLKPRVSTCNPNLMKFTVVDTSSVRGGKFSNVRELRYLPAESTIASNLSNHLKDDEGKFFKNSLDEYKVYASDMPMNVEKNTNKLNNHSTGTFDTSGPNGLKFTVVDTSLLHGEKSSKVRETRYLPVELKSTSKLTSLLRETDGTSSEDSLDGNELDAADILLNSEKNILSDSDDTNQKEIINNSDTTANKIMEGHQDEKATMSDDRQLKMTIKHQFSRRVKSVHSNYVAPVSKRRKLTVCAKAKRERIVEDFSEGLELKEAKPFLALNSPDAGKNVSSQEKVSIMSSSKGSPDKMSGGGILSGNSSGMDLSYGENEKHQSPPSLDLNLPQVPLKYEETGDVIVDVKDDQGINADGSCSPSKTMELVPDTLRTSIDAGAAKQQPNMNPRRQSTRNRPPTVRALEALANGFLSVQKRHRSTEVQTRENPFSSPSRKARSRIKVTSNRGSTSTKAIEMEEKEVNEACNANKPLDPSEKDWLTSY
ncbi:uncharacterized protein LOC132171260 isoform X2 [Corylus avellana]|nr:uncharacterized protein LOC132171260 isoform X2 [Corylus avellana]XP_059438518.1 uncharacterized protein LOC132171260 isoform X2 [Corylus avellana]XP_059438519.1 uncharacterized protein LOC132171260 isoform X2 [Corylus avellana]